MKNLKSYDQYIKEDFEIDDEYSINKKRDKNINKILDDLKYARKQINKVLTEISRKKYDTIPIDEIFDVVEKYGLVPLQEDNTRWEGMLLGENSNTYIPLAWKSSGVEKDGYKFYTPLKNTILSISWYKFETGRYEITTYLG